MNFTAAVAGELADLTAALDDPEVDLAAGLAQLATSVRTVVSSYRGMTVTTRRLDPPLTLTVLEAGTRDADVRASLMLELGDSVSGAPTVPLIFYASTPGAFVDLAADVSWLTSARDAAVVLDQHLSPAPSASLSNLRSASTVNQALGVLMGRGLTPADAHGELQALASRAGTDRVAAAQVLLATLDGSEPS